MSASVATPVTIANLNFPTNPAPIDLEGDGILELFVRTGGTPFSGPANTGVWVLLEGTGTGSFLQTENSFESAAEYRYGDFNGDGRIEALDVSADPMTVHSIELPGPFPAVGVIELGGCVRPTVTLNGTVSIPAPPSIVDLDRDGRDDLVALCDGVVTSFHNVGDFRFEACALGPPPAECGPERLSTCFDQDVRGRVSALDFNNDGLVDFVRADGDHALALGVVSGGGSQVPPDPGEPSDAGPNTGLADAGPPPSDTCSPVIPCATGFDCVGGVCQPAADPGGGGGEPLCGDGVTTVPEQCDDGNTASLDGCSSVCVLERPCAGDADCQTGQTCSLGQGGLNFCK